MTRKGTSGFGANIAPPRFVLFIVVMAVTVLVARFGGNSGLADAMVNGFDLAALVFMASLLPFMRSYSLEEMRRHAAENDANREIVLGITVLVSAIILAAISAELPAAKTGNHAAIIKLVGTLALSWVFASLVFMMHYAHMFYATDDETGELAGGFDFPGTERPDYWDFLYFSFTAGMSFAASDVSVTRGAIRRVVVLQCLLSFVFNIGALAFTLNVLASIA